MKMKTVAVTVDFYVQVPEEFTDEQINGITFEIEPDSIGVNGENGDPLEGASVTGYGTQEYVGE